MSIGLVQNYSAKASNNYFLGGAGQDKFLLWLNIFVSLEVRCSKFNICKRDLVEESAGEYARHSTLGIHQEFQANKMSKFKISLSNFVIQL